MDKSVEEFDLLKRGACQCLGMLIRKVSRGRSDVTFTFSSFVSVENCTFPPLLMPQ